MKTYTANEIIDKAYSLQDLQNSAFIGHDEALSLLNDHYLDLYEKQINKAEKLFLTRITLTTPNSTEKYNNTTLRLYTLPTDFFQLRAIYNIKDMSLIVEKPVSNFNPNTICYEIQNNSIVIYGPESAIGEGLVMEYYPQPQTITAPDPDDTGDTTIDYIFSYPNNLFYSVLAYSLALDFLSKQGSPTEWVAQQLSNATETFYNTLARTTIGSTRIANVYSVNGSYMQH